MANHDVIQSWQEHALNYPTKALIRLIDQRMQMQEDLIERLKGQLDGQMWSPNQWREDSTSSDKD